MLSGTARSLLRQIVRDDLAGLVSRSQFGFEYPSVARRSPDPLYYPVAHENVTRLEDLIADNYRAAFSLAPHARGVWGPRQYRRRLPWRRGTWAC